METKTKCALFIAEKPKVKGVEQQRNWGNFLGYAQQTLGKNQESQTLNEGTYLLPLDSGLHTLASLVRHAKEFGLVSRILFFDQEPSWILDQP